MAKNAERVCRATFIGRIVDESRATSMRRPASVKPFSWSPQLIQPDCRPTGGTVSLQPFLLRKVVCSAIDIADRRPAGGAQRCHPEFSNHRFALLPSALFVELLPRCQLVVLDWKRVLPSRSRTECLRFRRRCSSRVPQSPELGDLLLEPVKQQPFFAPVVRCDYAKVRKLHPSPTADEVRSPVFAATTAFFLPRFPP